MDFRDIKLPSSGYAALSYSAMKKNKHALDAATKKVLSTKISDAGCTLEQSLTGPIGFFAKQTNPAVVVFMNGKYHKTYLNPTEDDAKIIKTLAEKTDSFPYVFGQTLGYKWY